MKKLIILAMVLFSSASFAGGIECAYQLHDETGHTTAAPKSFGTMYTLEDEAWVDTDGYRFWANKMGDNTVGVVIINFKNNYISNAIGTWVGYDTYSVMAQQGEGDGTGRGATILCKLVD